MKKIGIVGMGAIGAVLAKYLIRNIDNQYYFFTRTKHQSISVEFDHNEDDILLNLPHEKRVKLDWLIICLKEYHIKEAIPDIQSLIDDQTKLAIFQNGIDIAKPYCRLTNETLILETVIDCPVERIDRTRFKQYKIPIITISMSQLADEFINLFTDEEIQLKQTQDFKRIQWLKLIDSSAIGSIQCVTEQPCAIFQETKYVEEYKLLVKEGMKVANSVSISLDKDLSNQLVNKLLKYPKSKGSSMLSDKIKGNMLELEAKIGAIVKVAKQQNIKVPNSERYYKSLLNYNEVIRSKSG